MKTITQKLMFLFLLLVVGVGYSQKVAVIGINHFSTAPATDGFTFVVTQDLAASEVIYFTENEYSDAANTFVDNAEATVAFTAGSTIVKGTVVFVNESVTTADTFTVTCTGGGSCGTAVKLGASGFFALATDGETFYAYSDNDTNPVNGVTTIHSVMFTGDTQPAIVNGGIIPVNQNPSFDYPTAIVIDGFPAVPPNRVEFTPTTLARTDVSKVVLENPSNYVHALTNQALSIIFFTNLNLVASNPVVTVTASPLSVNENNGAGMVYTFTLSANATSNLTINFAVSGSATFSSDYTQSGAASFNASTGTVTILNGSNTASITLTPVGDVTLEANESITLTLSSGTGYVAGSPGAATTTINNDDTLTITPLVAVTGVNHSTTTDGFSFVALQDITAGTVVYFTENPFDSATLTFTGAESVVSWTAPAGGLARGQVVVATETGLNTFATTCSSGTCGNVGVVSGNFTLATTGEELYAYLDADNNPTNGVTSVHAVLYTGTSVTPGGTIPTNQDPGTMYPGAVVVDGFPAVNPLRTEYNPSLRGVTVDKANFQNPANWLHAQSNITLSTVPFANIIISTGVANPFASVTVSPSSVLENSGTPMVYTFTLTAPASGNITVNFGVSGSATFTTDYIASGASTFTAASGSVVIPNGSSSVTVQITPVGDTALEIQESVVLTITSGTGYDGGSPNAATGLINNDDTTDSDPIVAITGISHFTTDGFSFVAAQDIPANTVVYFTDNSFNNNSLLFGSGEAVVRWTSPGTVITKGNVVVVTETVTPDTFTVTCSNGTCGSVALLSGNFALATNGESLFAYEDNDTNPSNGVVDIYSVLFTGTPTVIGGNIPTIQDPSSIFLSALVVDDFPATAPARTEYDATKRGVLVTEVNFEDISNWVHAQSPPALSTVPFANLSLLDAVAPNAICQNISVTPNVGTGSVTITAADINNGSTDNVGIVSYAIDVTTFTCANIGTPVTVTLTVTDAAGNSDTCTATVTVLPNAVATFTQVDPICAGSSFTLPTTSNNGTTGTWAPAINNTTTTTYTFTPNVGQCASSATMTVVVNPSVTPTFNSVAAICAGDALTALPTTSLNGITGTWSPALNNAATTLYTFTPNVGQCASTALLTITVNPIVTPTFNSIAAICAGDALTALPTTSLNGITGTWSPALNNAATTLYTFTPNVGQCASTASLTITVNPIVTPTFNSVAAICAGDALTALPTTSLNGITGTWSPALNNAATTLYTFTPNVGQCALTASLTITVNPVVTPTFNSVAAICEGDALTALPTTSLNGITGTWSPALNNAATTLYTFTPDAGQCASTATLTITVNVTPSPVSSNINVTITESCESISGEYNFEGVLNGKNSYALVNNSNFKISFDGIKWVLWTGIISNTGFINNNVPAGLNPPLSGWTPTLLTGCLTGTLTISGGSNFNICSGSSLADVPVVGANLQWYDAASNGSLLPASTIVTTGTYYVTQTISGCESVRGAVSITVNPLSFPTFDPVGAICAGDTLTALPTTSLNGITGTWSPALNNAATTLYTFTPNVGQCASTASLTITVNPVVTPTFNSVAAICAGDALSALPTTSLNGITGTWSPALNNAATTLYTFTPNVGQCASTASLTITVNPIVTPTFNSIAGICAGDALTALPTTSLNGITGTWSPALNNAATTLYTFTPNVGQCASTASLTITVNPIVTPTFNSVAAICAGDALTALPTTSLNGITGTWSPALNNAATTLYTFTPNAGQCALTASLTIVVNVTPVPSGASSQTFQIGATLANMVVSGTAIQWYDAANNGNPLPLSTVLVDGATYYATQTVNGCESATFAVQTSVAAGAASLTGTYCGATLNNANVTLVANYVIGAQGYRFRVRNTATNAVVLIVDRPVNSFALSNYAAITLGTTYTIDVALRIGGVWQSFFGLPCSVTTPTPVTTIGAQCGTTLTSMGQWIFATVRPNVTGYRFRITNTATTAVEVYTALNGLNKFNFNQLPAAFRSFGTVYSVEVALRNTDGTYLPFGTACNITTPNAAKTVVASNEFVALTYPNPFAENFMFDVKTASESTIQIRVYDMLGKQIENRNVEVVDIKAVQLGDVYPSGVYNVILSQDDNVQTLRVIKR